MLFLIREALMLKRSIVLVFLLCLHGFSVGAVENSPDAVADSQPDYSDTLLGDWGGRRGSMSAHGYDWEIVYKLDLLSKMSKPNRKTYGLDKLDIKLSLDGRKNAGLKGTSGLLYILSNHGSKPALMGDRLPHGLGKLETPYNANTTKI